MQQRSNESLITSQVQTSEGPLAGHSDTHVMGGDITTNWSTGRPAGSHRSAFVILIKDRRIIGDIKQIYEGRGTHIKSDQMTCFISIPVYSVREIVKEKTMELS